MNEPFIEFFSTGSHRVIKLQIFTRLDIFIRPILLLNIFFSFYPLAFHLPPIPILSARAPLPHPVF
jgi:hypothetical protein